MNGMSKDGCRTETMIRRRPSDSKQVSKRVAMIREGDSPWRRDIDKKPDIEESNALVRWQLVQSPMVDNGHDRDNPHLSPWETVNAFPRTIVILTRVSCGRSSMFISKISRNQDSEGKRSVDSVLTRQTTHLFCRMFSDSAKLTRYLRHQNSYLICSLYNPADKAV